MIFGMSTACFFPNVFTEETIDLLAGMNIRNIEVFFSCMSEYKKSFITELKKRILDRGLNVYSVHALSTQFEPQLFTVQKRARQEAYDIFKQVLEAGAQLGAQAYVFHGPSNIKHTRKLVLNYTYIAENVCALADTAMDYDIKLAWENVHWCWYSKPDFASELLKLPSTENLYFTLDIKQAAQAGYNPKDFLTGTQGRLVNIHICDFSVGEDRGICPVLPFRGSMDFNDFRTALTETGYDNAIILEVYKDSYSDYKELSDNYKEVVSFFSK